MCAYYIKIPEYLPNKLGESIGYWFAMNEVLELRHSKMYLYIYL